MKNTKAILIVAILLIVFAGGGFYAGMKYQQTKSPRFGNLGNLRNGQFGQRAPGFRPVNGEILSIDGTSITVKLPDGSSKIVILSDSTTYNKAAAGAKTDLKIGERIAVIGTENSDGSMTAQSVQLNPQFRGIPVASP